MTPEPIPAITAQIGQATLTIQIGSSRHWAYMTLFTKSSVEDGAYCPAESVTTLLTKVEATKLRDCLNTLIDNLPSSLISLHRRQACAPNVTTRSTGETDKELGMERDGQQSTKITTYQLGLSTEIRDEFPV